jgi:hypothetical protein
LADEQWDGDETELGLWSGGVLFLLGATVE